MKKILLAILIFTLIAVCFSLPVFALETNGDMHQDTQNTQPENLSSEELIDTGVEQNVFTEFYNLVSSNIDKIFSALSFGAALILAFAYKRGLLPLLSSALSLIKNKLTSFEGDAKESMAKTEETVKLLFDKFAFYTNSVELLSSSVEEILEKLSAREKDSQDLELFRTVMLSEVEMLYDIFMQSSLPQYSKDAVGERVKIMKERLSSGAENE